MQFFLGKEKIIYPHYLLRLLIMKWFLVHN